ncbi:hypothetical protein ASE69_07765 [Sphingomonas sp. Leaf208]|uniref:hypothetical protein n=1 Tax=Sphingomonas sp. Leaf208 TaxID=1735679 RepID=UPI0006F9BBE1|nr:hypothetical protein [Sphingomonas sp. Leaf208]KQM51204.1 hypothetical protein ASE69_07765 [Sphingomonas sp. Leaf208]
MGLDLYAAAKIENGFRTEPTQTLSATSYYDPKFCELWTIAPRELVKDLYDAGYDYLANLFYGDEIGSRYNHAAETWADMPAGLRDSDLPRTLTVRGATELADDLDQLANEFDVAETVKYLRFWSSRGHPIMCSY